MIFMNGAGSMPQPAVRSECSQICKQSLNREIGEDLLVYDRNLAEDRPMGAILVEHLQRIPPPRGTRGRRDVEISTVAHRLKTLAVDLSCPIVTTAQISRQVVQRAGKIPRNKPLGDAHVLGAKGMSASSHNRMTSALES